MFIVIICYHVLPPEGPLMYSDRWLTLDDLAEYLKLGRTTLYRLAQSGEIPGSKVANQWRFDRFAVDAWVRAQRSRGPSDSPARERD